MIIVSLILLMLSLYAYACNIRNGYILSLRIEIRAPCVIAQVRIYYPDVAQTRYIRQIYRYRYSTRSIRIIVFNIRIG